MLRVLAPAALAVVLLSPVLMGQTSTARGGTAFRVLGLSVMETANQLGLPPAQPTGPMVYHGGPLMSTSRAYTIFWRPPGTFMDPNYQTLINRYFTDVGGSTLYGITTQYSEPGQPINNVSQLGGTWTDAATVYPANPLTLADVLTEIEHAINQNNWPHAVNDMYFLYLARGAEVCIGVGVISFGCFLGRGGPPNARSWCAVHAAVQNPQTQRVINGALMPYAGTSLLQCGPQTIGRAVPNNNPDADAEISITSHEHLEAVTDPYDLSSVGLPGPHPGWYDQNVFEGEIADLCAWRFGARAPDGGNITMNGHRYLVQKEYSNNLLACTI